MKKFMLGLLAFLGMALGFTACGDKEESEKQEKTAAESGVILYESYVAYDQYKDDNSAEGVVAKGTAAVNLYQAYQAYENNKENKEWTKEFATSAASTAVEAKTDIDINDKEAAKTAISEKLLTALTDGTISEGSNRVEQIQAAAELYKILNGVF